MRDLCQDHRHSVLRCHPLKVPLHYEKRRAYARQVPGGNKGGREDMSGGGEGQLNRRSFRNILLNLTILQKSQTIENPTPLAWKMDLKLKMGHARLLPWSHDQPEAQKPGKRLAWNRLSCPEKWCSGTKIGGMGTKRKNIRVLHSQLSLRWCTHKGEHDRVLLPREASPVFPNDLHSFPLYLLIFNAPPPTLGPLVLRACPSDPHTHIHTPLPSLILLHCGISSIPMYFRILSLLEPGASA